MSDDKVLATLTGEFVQPVRIHYKVLDHKRLLRLFRKLRCTDYDPSQDRWVWLYDNEAKGIKFKQPYAVLPKQLHPIVIGSFFIRAKDKMLLDVRSCERAIKGIVFFDKHLPHTVVKTTDAEVVNRLFRSEDSQMTPDSVFDDQVSTARDPEADMQKLRTLAAQTDDHEEKSQLVLDQMQANSKRPLPEIERFAIHYYEDGITGFAAALRMRQLVALQHWMGHGDFTMFDAIQKSISHAVTDGPL